MRPVGHRVGTGRAEVTAPTLTCVESRRCPQNLRSPVAAGGVWGDAPQAGRSSE